MRCRACRKMIEPYLEGVLPPSAAEAVRNHLSGCPECARELSATERLGGLLARSRAPLPPEGYFVSFWPRLRERLPRRGAVVERPRFGPVRRPAVALAAASLLLAVMVYYFSPGAGIRSFPGSPVAEVPAAYVIARPDGDGSAELERDYVLALPASEPAGNYILARATSGAGADYW